MEYKYSKVEREGPITIVTLNRPESMNALHKDAHFELEAIFDDFNNDPDQWIAIVTGAGEKAFCAGNDLKVTASGDSLSEGGNKTGFGGLTSRFDMNKPVIAAVNGVAMGGGFEIVLACDIVIAAENAIFALPEPRVGLAALAGGVLRLPRQIGEKRAMGMILTSRRVTAAEGKELGFVNDISPKGEVLELAKQWARQIMEASPMSIRASKEAVKRGMEMPLDEAMAQQWDFPAMKALFDSEDSKEGPLAFAEKRAPQWKGN